MEREQILFAIGSVCQATFNLLDGLNDTLLSTDVLPKLGIPRSNDELQSNKSTIVSYNGTSARHLYNHGIEGIPQRPWNNQARVSPTQGLLFQINNQPSVNQYQTYLDESKELLWD